MKPIAYGSTGPEVREMQEWLTLAGQGLTLDGKFGPATQRALNRVAGNPNRSTKGASADDLRIVYGPKVSATSPWSPEGESLSAAIVRAARQHLAENPREVGGQNKGPWVRLYTGGPEVAWCAGFATTVIAQAARAIGVRAPGHLGFTLSCDVLAARAARANALSSEPTVGGLFLVRASATDWTHTGIVTAINGDGTFDTVEGNTNDEGSREGYEVCARVRAIGPKYDFVGL